MGPSNIQYFYLCCHRDLTTKGVVRHSKLVEDETAKFKKQKNQAIRKQVISFNPDSYELSP